MSWDLDSYFPAFNGPEMRRFKTALQDDIDALRQRAGPLPPLTDSNAADWESVFLNYEELLKRMSHLGSYVSCLASADSRNEEYIKEEGALAVMRAELSKLRVELLRSLKEAPEELFASFAARESFQGAEYYLRRLREESRRTMAPEKEVLAAELGVDGIRSWGRLYDRISAKLEFDMEYPDGRRERVPMSQRRSLMEHADRRVRRGAFEGGNRAWQGVEDVTAAALNAIAGTRLTLNRHRGVRHFLEIALFQAGITERTLNAMFEAVFAEAEIPRRILGLKAKFMGTEAAAWYDLGAPLPLPDHEPVRWESATALVRDSFSRSYPRLGAFLRSVYDKNWIDWEPRPGKRPGGFCTGSLLTQESRIFMTHNGALGDILTLAHESGHAFHNYVTRDLRPYARSCPMTLAETASTFGELILITGVLDDPAISPAQKARMLDMEIGHAAIYLLDIPVRYEFEKALYEERGKGELSVSRLKALMAETQRRVLGDVLEAGGEDPYFWASKLHFYITGITFYNFPYTFGFLLSRSLFALFKQEGAAFLPRYENLLRLAGSDTVENVVRRSLGRDPETPEFWVEAIRGLEEPLNRLETLSRDLTR